MTNNLKHLAIIMDGNGRWAKKRNLPIIAGHKQGAEVARKILIACIKFKIPYLTLYTFSTENWNRDKQEVDDMMSLLKFYLINELDLLIENGVKIKIIGNREQLPEEIVKLVERCENATENNQILSLQLALSYGSRQEIIDAQKKLFSSIVSGTININELDEKFFESFLYTANIPDPDLLIRTSGEKRISNFLLWQLAYAELYFTKTLWPDFTPEHLKRAIGNFNKRERRYGLSK